MKASAKQIKALEAGKPVPITEEEWQGIVVHLAHLRGWLVYHTHDSRHSEEGFPDLVLVRESGKPKRTFFAELKAAGGKLSPAQERWRDALLAAGEEWYCWYPADWHDVEEILR